MGSMCQVHTSLYQACSESRYHTVVIGAKVSAVAWVLLLTVFSILKQEVYGQSTGLSFDHTRTGDCAQDRILGLKVLSRSEST